jgi:hypothetical protein
MTLTELFTNIANAIRAKTGSTEPIIAEDFPSAIEAIEAGSTIDLDAEVTEQETIAASQDTLVENIMAALEGKAVGGGKTTKTINIDWSGDEELTCSISYISNNEIISIRQDQDVYESIEAEGGIIIYNYNGLEGTSNFIYLGSLNGVPLGGDIYVATKDGETVYPISSGTQ